ncbi:1,3-beta-galactosyl-N-acetylhexosamine phosphorylase [Bifidobacterium sp. W8113]|uniref:1,3-beta-galactosyl-N-acetylhexosamine phosphorylase n=1 Tax=Bifidobacterium choladohabitans TaxID=2750947 RepID=UPI0018DBA900|nr:1,3-beta-galactosyl-N-acetylhexosamine phosphorylase [Bifidobacterium choladohabitans]MBI0089909.1 1,3-beta-galactosyl-N-acetylhexosamine phosphorylase [Bifidobacterium choladohabitans]
MSTTGRFTLPGEEHFVKQTEELCRRWGADAIRNSDGTSLDRELLGLGKKVYSAYFPARGYNEWIREHMGETPQVFLLTDRVLAQNGRVDIDLMTDFFDQQFTPNRDDDPHRYWEVIDRTTGAVLPDESWNLDPDLDRVHIEGAMPMHEYTVTFLARIIWDPVEMYNHLTNDWGDREHQIPLDIYHPATRDFAMKAFARWLKDNPSTDVVRFTTFFYQFTLLYDQHQQEKIVDWLGYACTVSPRAIEDFSKEYGYRPRAEDFVRDGSYNSSFLVPTRTQRDWMDFISHFVRTNVATMVDMTHAAGKEAMMFLGDQWIGTEPYRPGFSDLKLDAVVGSVGDGTTLRMIADIPGVRYTEGRFLPYFFPDTFHEGNDPSIEGLDNWRKARRAILRSPISRMGYGGYPSLAIKFPKFVDTVAAIAEEFRDLHRHTGSRPAATQLTVAVLNSWGAMRSWMAYTVAHALPNQQTASYYGILEALSGMRVSVRFISFDDLLSQGVDPDIDVIICGGPEGTAFSGGTVWKNPELVRILRTWTENGGGLIGVGQPTALDWQGRFFQLADIFGVDQERYRTLSVDKHFSPTIQDHFITHDLPGNAPADFGHPILDTYPIDGHTSLLRADGGQVQLAVRDYGSGRGVYLSGLPYSAVNARLLERALFWAAHKEERYRKWSSDNPECEVAVFPQSETFCVINNSEMAQRTEIRLPGGASRVLDLGPSAIVWQPLPSEKRDNED